MFYFSITPIIICRFTLDLRQVKSPGSSWVSGSQSASLRFVGNAGGLLHFGGDDVEEGEENAVEQTGQTEGSGAPLEDKEGDSSMTMTRDHRAAQSVSILVIHEQIHRSHVIVKSELLTANIIAALEFQYPGVKPTL